MRSGKGLQCAIVKSFSSLENSTYKVGYPSIFLILYYLMKKTVTFLQDPVTEFRETWTPQELKEYNYWSRQLWEKADRRQIAERAWTIKAAKLVLKETYCKMDDFLRINPYGVSGLKKSPAAEKRYRKRVKKETASIKKKLQEAPLIFSEIHPFDEDTVMYLNQRSSEELPLQLERRLWKYRLHQWDRAKGVCGVRGYISDPFILYKQSVTLCKERSKREKRRKAERRDESTQEIETIEEDKESIQE